jgi:hypothetical protein
MLMFSSSPDAVTFIVAMQKRSMIRTPENMTGTPNNEREQWTRYRMS